MTAGASVVEADASILGLSAPWPAPAKLNLCLHIVGRRADGYHELQSALQFVDLCDQLRFHRRPPGVIERFGDVTGVEADSDLALRAARHLAAVAGSTTGVAIEIDKRIPIGGGLGGGSSDAATVLVALNRLWSLGLDAEALARIGLELGADVPVFVRGRAAWVEGVGERLTPCDFVERDVLIVRPQSAISTAEIFQAPELTRNSPVTTIRAFLADGGRNDCEPTVRRRYPEVGEVLDWLREFSEARLTGTGSCVFATFADAAAARRVLAQVPGRWQGYVARSLNRSPLLDRASLETQS